MVVLMSMMYVNTFAKYIILWKCMYVYTLLRVPWTLEILRVKEIQPVHPKGNQSWIFFGRTDAEVEALILWPPDPEHWLIGKGPDIGKDWRQEEKGTTEDEMVGWHYWLDGHEFEQAPGADDGQGSLMWCTPWDCKELDMTKQLNWTDTGLQHTRPPCPSPAARVNPNSCPLHRPLGLPRWFNGKESACQVGWPASVPGLGRSLEKEMATLPSLLAWKSHGQRNLGGCSPWDHQWVGHDLMTKQGTEGSSNLPKGGRRGGREMGGKQVDRSLSKLQLILRAFFPNPN